MAAYNSDDEYIPDVGQLSLTPASSGGNTLSTNSYGGGSAAFFQHGLSLAINAASDAPTCEEVSQVVEFDVPIDVYNGISREQALKMSTQTYQNNPAHACNLKVHGLSIKEDSMMREYNLAREMALEKFNEPVNGVFVCTAKLYEDLQGMTNVGLTPEYLRSMPTYPIAYLKNMNEFFKMSEKAADLHYQISITRVIKGYWEVMRRKEEAKKQSVEQRKKAAKLGSFTLTKT